MNEHSIYAATWRQVQKSASSNAIETIVFCYLAGRSYTDANPYKKRAQLNLEVCTSKSKLHSHHRNFCPLRWRFDANIWADEFWKNIRHGLRARWFRGSGCTGHCSEQ